MNTTNEIARSPEMRCTPEQLYTVLWTFAAVDGRENSLFGPRFDAGLGAFSRSLAGCAFPEIWFEIPLKGDPWFDLHVLTRQGDLTPGTIEDSRLPDGMGAVFRWAAGDKRARQMSISWDIGTREKPLPAIQLLVWDPAAHENFLRMTGGPDAAKAYLAFRERVPRELVTCYTGAFTARGTAAVRTENIPKDGLADAYRGNLSLLEKDLRRIGLPDAAAAEAAAFCRESCPEPFFPEFQFDVLPDGTVTNTFSLSIRFSMPPGTPDRPMLKEDNEAGAIFRTAERLGLADGRWRQLTQLSMIRTLPFLTGSDFLFCYPAFIKLKWKKGRLSEAKAYLQAGIFNLHTQEE